MTLKFDFSGQSISWFNDRLKEESLVFKPPFQRNPVWLEKHKAYLVDTVLHNLPVPEIYIQKETDETGNTIYSIVDGQQRVRALLEFPLGRFSLLEKFSPGRDGVVWDDLGSEEKKRFWNYRLVVREIEGATDDELRDLFQRLNQHTIALNAQELRNARFKGDFIQTVTELADQDFWSDHRLVSANEIRRMLDIEYVAELLVGVMHGPQNKKTSLDKFFESYEERIPGKDAHLKRFEAARSASQALLPDLRATRWRGKSDFYSLFLCLADLSQGRRLASAKQKEASKALHSFGEAVTSVLSKTGGRKVPPSVLKYANAVEKAASDKDRRETRHEVLTRLLEPFFK
jgi:hypothetical protein